MCGKDRESDHVERHAELIMWGIEGESPIMWRIDGKRSESCGNRQAESLIM